MTSISIHTILTVCHQHGVDFRLERGDPASGGEKVLFSGDINKIGKPLLAVIKARKADGSLQQFFRDNPDWKPGKAPETVARGETQSPPEKPEDAGAEKHLEEARASVARSTAQENSTVQKKAGSQGTLPLSGPPAAAPGPPPAAPAAPVAPVAPAQVPSPPHDPGVVTTPPMPPPRGRLVQSVSPERAADFKAAGGCFPCNVIWYVLVPSELDPRRCELCGNALVGVETWKKEGRP